MSRTILKQLGRFSIRRQVILLFFLIVVLPFLFIGYFAYSKSIKAIQDVSSFVSMEMMVKNAKVLDNYLDLVDNAQSEIMYSKDMQELLSIRPSGELEELEITSRLVQYTSLLNRNTHAYTIRIFPIEPSRYPTFTHTIYQDEDIESQAWFRLAKEMKTPYWQLFLPQDNPILYKEPYLSKIKQLYGLNQSKPLGFVIADIKASTLSEYLAPVKMVDRQQVVLLNENNTIVYHQEAERIGTRFDSPELDGFLKQSTEAASRLTIEGVQYMATYATLTHNDWKVLSLIPVSVLTRPVSGIERISFLFLLFYLAISVFTVAFFTYRFTNPIQKLVKAMRKVEHGETVHHWPQLTRSDEIGWLYMGFDNMVRKIDELVSSAEKEAKDKKELEFQVLTHQINPHFLYNTLEAIRWKAESRQASDISEMVRSLGNLLRLSLNDGRELTTVEREIEHVKAYVAIQSARQDTSIRVVYMIDEDILPLPCMRLMLQPLVENAIKHGTRHAGDGEAVKILIRGSLEPYRLQFEIVDNGPGIPEALRAGLLTAERNIPHQRKGVGLRNVHERLALYFGERYGLQIENRDEGGTVIGISHPILDADPAQRDAI